MTAYEYAGPKRFEHQQRGLNKMITTGGITALLFDPGTGKTATTLDYMGLLALKAKPREDGVREVRVLVVCPLVAVDTWVIQAEKYMSPMVNYWAESIGGSLLERAEIMAARGGNPKRYTTISPREPLTHPRALHVGKAWALGWRGDERERPMTPSEGPEGLGTSKPRVVLLVTNIDTMVSRTAVGGKTMADVMLDSVKRFNPELVVVDESHKIKSAQGNASRLMARIGQHVRRRIILTGTVMPHSPLDVFGQWNFLEPYAFGDTLRDGSRRKATFSSFKGRYAIQGGYLGHEIIGFRNLDDMQTVMARNAAVARKKDALDLPDDQDIVIPVHLSPKEKQAYADMKGQLAAVLAPGVQATVPNKLAQMMRLRQITAGHLPDDQGVTHTIGTSKAATIASLVHDTLAGEKRVVVFAYFGHEIAMLGNVLARAGTEVMTISGGTAGDDRMSMRLRFGSDAPERIVMIAQITTMSLAVNELVTASHAVFASLTPKRDDIVQARDRLNRIGQTRPTTFWFALAPGTVDDVIYQSYVDRSNLEAAMLKHIFDQA